MHDCLFVPQQGFRKVVNMQYVLTGSEMSDCDARTSQVIGIPSLVLMERAALSVADGAEEYLTKNSKIHGSVLIVAGRGNNGADGLAVRLPEGGDPDCGSI
jgi:NAD(P)H-hydrate epimerase